MGWLWVGDRIREGGVDRNVKLTNASCTAPQKHVAVASSSLDQPSLAQPARGMYGLDLSVVAMVRLDRLFGAVNRVKVKDSGRHAFYNQYRRLVIRQRLRSLTYHWFNQLQRRSVSPPHPLEEFRSQRGLINSQAISIVEPMNSGKR